MTKTETAAMTEARIQIDKLVQERDGLRTRVAEVGVEVERLNEQRNLISTGYREQLDRADKAEARVERLTKERRSSVERDLGIAAARIMAYEDDLNWQKASVERLTAAIKNAPHGRTCNTHAAFQTANGFPCDCWKRSALSPEGKEGR